MVKETAKGGVSSALAPKAGTAHPENTPDCLKKLEETLKFNVLDSNADISEGLEIDMVGGVEQVLLGAAKSQQFVAVLRTAGVTPEHKSVNLAIVNAMWIWGTQTDATSEATRWAQVGTLVKEVASSGLVDTTILLTSLELNLLVAAGLAKDETAHQKRFIRINTNMVFKQQKYNLLREETEGYSKLSVMLCNEMPQSCHEMSEADLTAATALFVTNVFSVVGHFDLEPNRVLDLILDAFEEQPLNRCFLPLIRRFKPTTTAHMLGFKFTMHHLPRVLRNPEPEAPAAAVVPAAKANGSKGSAATAPAPAVPASLAATDKLITNAHSDVTGSDAPQSLYILAAVLIMNKLVDFEDLLPYLRPSLDRLAATLAAIETDLAQQAAAFGVVSLNAAKPSGKEKPLGSAVNSGPIIPASIDVTKDTVVTKTATSSGRRPPLPAAPAANSGVTILPTPPSAKPVAPAPASVPAAKPPAPSNPPPVSMSASTAALNRTQSTGKLVSDKAGAGSSTSEAAAKDEDAVEDARFTLFFNASESVETVPSQGAETGEVVPEVEHPIVVRCFSEGNEVVGLIAALLSVRGWEHAKYLLNLLETHGMDPLLVMKYSADLRRAMAALLGWHLEAAYMASSTSIACRGFSKPVSILPVVVRPVQAPKKDITRTDVQASTLDDVAAFLRKVPTTTEPQLQQIPSVLEFPQQSSMLLSYFGYHLREFPALFARLCRLSKAYIRQVSSTAASAMVTDTTDVTISDAALEPALSLISNVLLPALSAYAENNPFLAGQVWDTISTLPFVQRFALYDRWYGGGVGKEGLGSKHAEVVLAETIALHGARAELKRLAKENTKLIGRKLARFTQACPLVVFNHVLGQVEAFDNLIPYMVDTLKFSTELSKDVMAYSLVSQLKKGSSGDAKLKKGDTHFSQWFSALTKFIATYYCRYPTTELKGLLNYLLQRLSIGDSLDLLVLKELLGIMGSSETLLEVSAAQLEGLSGGRSLRAEVMGVAGGVVGSKGLISANACKKATLILREELIGSQTAIPLLLMIAQVRSRLLHDPETTELKLISHLYDTAQDVLMQFTEFLVAGAKSFESIAELMPELSVLLDEVGLAVPVAFQLVRPLLRAALQFGPNPTNAPPRLQRWHPFGETMTKLVTTLIHPASIWEVMSPRLYVLFWGLGLYDIKVPVSRYEGEIKRLKDKYTELDNKKSGTAASQSITAAEFSKLNKQRELEMKQLLQKVAELTEDMVRQKKHVEQIREIIRSEQASFFRVSASAQQGADDSGTVCTPEDVVSESMMQHLLFQRLLMSPIDAVYCTQFCFLLHEMQTPHFSTLRFVDRTIRTITPLIFCSTETEASFIGYALLDLLQVVNRWHDDEKVFGTVALGKLGFSFPLPSNAAGATAALVPAVQAMDVDGESSAALSSADGNAVMACGHPQFKEHCKAWHTRLFQIIRASLTVKDREYIYIRSGLILLAKVSEQFPSRAKEGDQLIALVEKLQAQETQRGDLQIMAKSLLTILKKRADSWFNDSPQRRLAAIKAEAARKKAAEKAAAAAVAIAKQVEPEDDMEEGETRDNRSKPAASTTIAGDRRTGVANRDDGLRRAQPSRDSLRDSNVGGSGLSGGRGADAASWRQDGPIRDARDSRDVPARDRDRAGSINQPPRDGRDSRERRSDSRERDSRDPRDKDRRASGVSGAGPISAPAIAASAGVKRKGVDDDRAGGNSAPSNTGGNAAGSAADGPANKQPRRSNPPAATSYAKVEEANRNLPPAGKDTSSNKKDSGKAQQQERQSGGNDRDRDSRDDTRGDKRPPPPTDKDASSTKQANDGTKGRDGRQEISNASGAAPNRGGDRGGDRSANVGASNNTNNGGNAGTTSAPSGNNNSGNASNKRSRDAADLSSDQSEVKSKDTKQSSSKRSSDYKGPPRDGAVAPVSQVAELLAMKDAAKNGGNNGGGGRRGDASANLSSLKVPSAGELSREASGNKSTGRGGNSNNAATSGPPPVHKDGLPGQNNLFPPSGGAGSNNSRAAGRFDDRDRGDRGGQSRGNTYSDSQQYPPQHQQQYNSQSQGQHQQYPSRGGAGAGYDDYHQSGGAGGPGGRGSGGNRRDGGNNKR